MFRWGTKVSSTDGWKGFSSYYWGILLVVQSFKALQFPNDVILHPFNDWNFYLVILPAWFSAADHWFLYTAGISSCQPLTDINSTRTGCTTLQLYFPIGLWQKTPIVSHNALSFISNPTLYSNVVAGGAEWNRKLLSATSNLQ